MNGYKPTEWLFTDPKVQEYYEFLCDLRKHCVKDTPVWAAYQTAINILAAKFSCTIKEAK